MVRARRLLAVALAFAAAVAVFSATRGDEWAAGPPAADAPSLRPHADTDASVRSLQAAVRRGAPREAELAAAYLQKARESGDPSFYVRADGVLRRAPARGPADPAELAEAAALAAGRHDFRAAERLALNFPVAGGTSGHFLGAALAAVLLGPWLASLVLAVVLVVQAFVFADGGITALGANVLNIGVLGGVVVGGLMLAARRALPGTRGALLGVAAGGAWLAVMIGAAACAIELAASGTVPLATVLPAMLGVHALIGAGEAAITVAAVSAVLATRPDLIHGPVPEPASPAVPALS